jgi:H+/Cl- antiporter ClcA
MTTDSPAEAPPRPSPRAILVLLLLAAVVGTVVSLAAWGFLELVQQIQVGVFTDLPRSLGYESGAPQWWPLPILAVAGAIAAAAILLLPGGGGHEPAHGLSAGASQPSYLPGVVLAALATLGLGAVLGPEAPLIAAGSGLGILALRAVRKDAPQQVEMVIAASGSFAAMSLIFDSPIIAAVILIEAAGLGAKKLPLVLVPGLLAAGIGSLVSVGLGSFTGLSNSAYALGAVPLPELARPDAADLAWTIPFAVLVAVGAFLIMRGAQALLPLVKTRRLLLTPLAGLAIAGLGIAFEQASGKDMNQVLFSGENALSPLVAKAGTWSLSALGLLILFKGIAWCISLSAFRGGPTFPALFLGAAAGLMASHLAGFQTTAAVAAGIAAAVVAVLRLPLAAVVLAVLLTAKSGPGSGPVAIVAVVVAYLTTIALSRRFGSDPVAGSPA